MLTAEKIQDITSSIKQYYNENYEAKLTDEDILGSIYCMKKIGFSEKEIKKHWDKILNG